MGKSSTENMQLPFNLALEDKQVLTVEQIVRSLPNKRWVAFGHWQGKAVVAKCFIHPKHAARHLKQELAGVKALQFNQIPTPALYHQGQSVDKRIQVLLFERIQATMNLEDCWLKYQDKPEIMPLLETAIVELATQHVLGIMQRDLHFKNFLPTKKTIYTLDGGQVKTFTHMLDKKTSIGNLAIFLAQLGVGREVLQEKLFRHYAKVRNWILKEEDITLLWRAIAQCNKGRWKRYQKKIFRESSAFAIWRKTHWQGMYGKHYALPDFLAMLEDPDSVFTHPSAVMLKAGRSSTVVKVTLDKRDYVIKRYNLKNIWHHLRRMLRQTRAAKSWRLAQKLCLFGVATAKPAGYIERNVYGLRSKSFFIMEYVAGKDAKTYLQENTHDVKAILQRIANLLNQLRKLKLTHGDLKISNILINTETKPVLIDLDGAKEHWLPLFLQRESNKDQQRFNKNFTDPEWQNIL